MGRHRPVGTNTQYRPSFSHGAGGSRKRSCLLTLHIGPGASDHPYADNGLDKPLRRRCSGTYNAAIFYEHGPKFTVIARFKRA